MTCEVVSHSCDVEDESVGSLEAEERMLSGRPEYQEEHDFDSELRPAGTQGSVAATSKWRLDRGPSEVASTRLGKRIVPEPKRHRNWIPLVAPMIATVILAITVWFQSGQLSATREANEDAQFREVIKTVAQAHDTDSEFAAFLLFKPFLASKRYRDTTRQLIITILPRVELYDTFEDLLSPYSPIRPLLTLTVWRGSRGHKPDVSIPWNIAWNI
jgi:hypothetical protein